MSTHLHVRRQAVQRGPRTERVCDDRAARKEAVERRLNRQFVAMDPPSCDSLGAVHGILILQKEYQDVSGQRVGLNGSRNSENGWVWHGFDRVRG